MFSSHWGRFRSTSRWRSSLGRSASITHHDLMKWSPRQCRILHGPVVHPLGRGALLLSTSAWLVLTSPLTAIAIDHKTMTSPLITKSLSEMVGWPLVIELTAIIIVAITALAHRAFHQHERVERNPFTKPVRGVFRSHTPKSQSERSELDEKRIEVPPIAEVAANLSALPTCEPTSQTDSHWGGIAASRPNGITSSHSFIYAAAHDLQEPLRKLKGQIHRITAQINPSQSEFACLELESMRKTAVRMQSLLDSLLSLARIQGRSARFERIHLLDVIQDAQSNLEPRTVESRAEFCLRVDDIIIDADRIQMLQLFQNLIANSLKFHAPDRTPRIQITTRSDSAASSETEIIRRCDADLASASVCEIRIEDNGIGFESTEWEGMVMGFHRQHGREEFEGTGLGLAICHSILERHGGHMTAVSQLGIGTTIIVRLPAHQKSRRGDTTWIASVDVPEPLRAQEPITPVTRCF